MTDLAEKIDVQSLMRDMGRAAKAAAKSLAIATAERKFAALTGMAQAIAAHTENILVANALDMALAHDAKLAPSMLDRLQLDKNRVRGMIDSIRSIAELQRPDRRNHRRMGPAQRPAYRARAHAARRHRRHL